MSSFRLDASFNSLTITSAATTRHLFDIDPRRLSLINAANMAASGVTIHQRRTSVVNQHQRRNSQLRKSSFTTSTVVCDIV